MSSVAAAIVASQAKKDRHIVSWTQEEDDLLREQVAVHGADNWAIIAAQFKDKTGRQCRRRWFTYLKVESKKGGWSPEEDMLLCEAQKMYGNRWTEIAKVVPGRSDNAVKNRFSTLCKKRAKNHTVSKENNESCVYPSTKRIMVSENINQIRGAFPDHSSSGTPNRRLSRVHGVLGLQSRPPFTVLTQNLNNSCNLPSNSQPDSGTKPEEFDAITKVEVRGTFLRRDDPKLTALLQQAELLSSLAIKASSENRSQSLEDAWKELQDYIIRTRDGEILRRKFSGMESLLDDFKDLIMDIQNEDSEIQILWREVDLDESQVSSELGIGCPSTHLGNNIDNHRLEHCSSGSNKEPSCKHDVILGPDGTVSSSVEHTQNSGNMLNLSKSEFNSPLVTIPTFHSFTEEIPTPEFSSSERKFLMSVLASPNAVTNTDQVPSCERDPQPNFSQSHSCKRVLLNSL